MKRLIPTLMRTAYALLFASPLVAQASITVDLQPVTQNIGVGDDTFINVVVSGLGDHTSPSIAAFDLVFKYSDSILQANSVSFGNYLDLGIFGSTQDFDLTPPGVFLLEVSLEESAALVTSQPASFVLATIGFHGVAAGTGVIGLDPADPSSLTDENANNLVFDFSGARITVSPAGSGPDRSVPDGASTLSLMIVGLTGMGLLHRRSAVPQS